MMKNKFLIIAQIALFFTYLRIMEVPLLGDSSITYTKDIQPIFQDKCVLCHNSSMPDKDWMNYELAFKNKDKIKKRLEERTMPPGNVTQMTEEERKLVIQWVDEGGRK